MNKLAALLYGLVAYLIAFFTLLYAVGFVTGVVVAKTIDSGAAGPAGAAIIVNILLMSLFAAQHSIMARRPFKQWLTQFVPATIERSTYVLAASLALVLLFWQWHPLPAIVWRIPDPQIAASVMGLSFAGFLLVLASTFLINHFELFGVHQVVTNLAGRVPAEPRFKTPALYRLVRHPIYLGFVIAFWAVPVMSVGHLLFSSVTTAYILLGIFLEERDLAELFGEEYRHYQQRVAMLVPLWRKS